MTSGTTAAHERCHLSLPSAISSIWEDLCPCQTGHPLVPVNAALCRMTTAVTLLWRQNYFIKIVFTWAFAASSNEHWRYAYNSTNGLPWQVDLVCLFVGWCYSRVISHRANSGLVHAFMHGCNLVTIQSAVVLHGMDFLFHH